MRIKLDENLPDRLAGVLQALGHDVDTVRAEHLAGRNDYEVWNAAQSVGRFLITQDPVRKTNIKITERTSFLRQSQYNSGNKLTAPSIHATKSHNIASNSRHTNEFKLSRVQ